MSAASREENVIIMTDTNYVQGMQQRRIRAAGTSARPNEQAQRAQGTGQRTANEEDDDVIDLTGSPDIEIVSSTVVRAPRHKRPRVSPAKQLLLQAAQPRTQPPAPSPEQPGPKCGICLEPMGGDSGRCMSAGSCGHVYCKECLTAAVQATKKCPTCRKSLQLRQLHQVFINF